MKIRTLSVVIEKRQTFPYVEKFANYQDIYAHKFYLSDFYRDCQENFCGEIFCAYLGFDGHWWGLFWLHDEQPTKEEIQILKDRANCLIDIEIPSNIPNEEGFVRRL